MERFSFCDSCVVVLTVSVKEVDEEWKVGVCYRQRCPWQTDGAVTPGRRQSLAWRVMENLINIKSDTRIKTSSGM